MRPCIRLASVAACAACFALVSCSTVRLTPSAARYLKEGKDSTANSERALSDYTEARNEYELARARRDGILRLIDSDGQLREALGKLLGLAPTEPPTEVTPARLADAMAAPYENHDGKLSTADAKRFELAKHTVRLWWTGSLEGNWDDTFERIVGVGRNKEAGKPLDQRIEGMPQLESQARLSYLKDVMDRRLLDVRQLQAVESGRWEYFVDGSVYFSIEPIVAIRPHLRAVAVPSLGINWRPMSLASKNSWFGIEPGDLGGLSAVGLQATFGGALNPSGADDTNSGGALGIGLSYPIASIGALSTGAIWFSNGNDAHAAPYISLTLGDFGKNTSRGGQ